MIGFERSVEPKVIERSLIGLLEFVYPPNFNLSTAIVWLRIEAGNLAIS